MEQNSKFIVKNIGKFKNIVLHPCISLNNCNKIFRYISDNVSPTIGASTGMYGQYWFIVNGEKAIFKTFETAPLNSLLRITNELVCQELAKQIDLPCARYEVAELDGRNGLISYNVTAENEKLISGAELFEFLGIRKKNNVLTYYEALQIGKFCGYKIHVTQEVLNLYKLCIFDYLTFQGDRHMNNLFFVFNEDKQTIKFSPIIDNEMSFCCMDIYPELLGNNQSLSLESILQSYNDSQMLSIYPLKNENNKHDDIGQQIIRFAKRLDVGMNVLRSVLNKINIEDAIENAEKHNIKISNEYKNFMINIFNYNINRLSQYLDLTTTTDTDKTL